MSKLNNMWQKIWGKQMNQIVEKVEQITANAGEAQKEVLKENFYKELIVQEEIRRRQKALDVADDRLKIQYTGLGIVSGLSLGAAIKLKNGIKKPFLTGFVIGATFGYGAYGFNKAYQWPVDLNKRAEYILENEPNILDLPSGLPPIPH